MHEEKNIHEIKTTLEVKVRQILGLLMKILGGFYNEKVIL